MHKVIRSKGEISSMLAAARRMARSYGQIGLVEPDDIAQEAMVKLLKKNDGRPPSESWLYKVVHSLAMDAGRSASREAKRRWRDFDGQAEAVCERADEHGHVRVYRGSDSDSDRAEDDLEIPPGSVLGGLSEPLKQVLVLNSQGYSYKEIADLMQTSVGTVRSRLHYARKQARRILSEMGLKLG